MPARSLTGTIEVSRDSATGGTVISARVGGRMGQLADSIGNAKSATVRSGATTGVQPGAGAFQDDQCADKVCQ